MVRAAALAILLANQPAGPAMLVIDQYDGFKYVPFSSFSRCEAALRDWQQTVAEKQARMKVQGLKPIKGTEPKAKCIPG